MKEKKTMKNEKRNRTRAMMGSGACVAGASLMETAAYLAGPVANLAGRQIAKKAGFGLARLLATAAANSGLASGAGATAIGVVGSAILPALAAAGTVYFAWQIVSMCRRV